MKTLKESLLSDIEDNLATGDDFVKGLDNEIANIQKEGHKNKKLDYRIQIQSAYSNKIIYRV